MSHYFYDLTHFRGLGKNAKIFLFVFGANEAERYTSPSKEAGLVIYLAFLANMILTTFKKYWPDTEAKFTSGTQDRFI